MLKEYFMKNKKYIVLIVIAIFAFYVSGCTVQGIAQSEDQVTNQREVHQN